uniref:Uncharacterized protein n=1 Tax=Parascaris equorum TaxID=6256 RepID=A0A914R8X0_PAREQ
MASPCGASISSPSDYLFLPPKQRMSIGIEAELVLYPEASVTLDKKLPDAAKRPRFVVTYPGATGKSSLKLLIALFSVVGNWALQAILFSFIFKSRVAVIDFRRKKDKYMRKR